MVMASSFLRTSLKSCHVISGVRISRVASNLTSACSSFEKVLSNACSTGSGSRSFNDHLVGFSTCSIDNLRSFVIARSALALCDEAIPNIDGDCFVRLRPPRNDDSLFTLSFCIGCTSEQHGLDLERS